MPIGEIAAARKEIVLVGGGLANVLAALMLAKNPDYHVTIIEEKSALLSGASMLAARQHRGGEYPLDDKTAADCLNGALIWKLLMPDNIYTAAPPMKFLVALATMAKGLLTPEKYLESYERIRLLYEQEYNRIKAAFKWDDATAEKMLLGSPEKGKFYRKLDEIDYRDFDQGATKIAGGFQSGEQGLNVPKYLAMLQGEVERQQRAGNIRVLTNQKVSAGGIKGSLGDFTITCNSTKTVKADQVIVGAWAGNSEILSPPDNDIDKRKVVTVYKRAMMLIRLPPGWKTPPAFIMLGEDGGMLSPYNDKIALCYLPVKEAAYVKDHVLTSADPALPEDWEKISALQDWKDMAGNMKLKWNELSARERDEVKDLAEAKVREERTKTYFQLLKKRFPVLEGLSMEDAKPRLLVRDTLNFQLKALEKRRHKTAQEVTHITPDTMPLHGTDAGGMHMEIVQKQQAIKEQKLIKYTPPTIAEVRQGVFCLNPTKATYAPMAALQACHMVEQRSKKPGAPMIAPPTYNQTLKLILSEKKRSAYSLSHMAPPDERLMAQFFREHPDFDPLMAKETWPKEPQEQQPWVAREIASSSYVGRT